MTSYAQRLKRLLLDLGVSQSDLARAIGLARNSVSKFCSGEIEPSMRTHGKITRHLERSGATSAQLIWLCMGD